MKYVLTAQHYDMAPGTVVYAVPNVLSTKPWPELFTVKEGEYVEPYLRLVPPEKVELSDVQQNAERRIG